MILAPDYIVKKKNKKNLDNNNDNKDLYRLFLLGRKKLPEIIEDKSYPTERNWALNIPTTSDSSDIERELLIPAEYPTETKGTRRLPAAIPTREGKYSIVKHDNHTELAYILELPERLAPSQREFEIKKDASYIVSVKNPEINVKGFASFAERKPQYPSKIKEMFGDKRWIEVQDPDLLNYEHTQLLLIGARKKENEEELEIEIDEEKENEKSAEIFKDLHIDKDKIPLKALFQGRFPTEKEIISSQVEEGDQKIKHLSKQEAPGRGGKKGEK